jgi:hypothetical protein
MNEKEDAMATTRSRETELPTTPLDELRRNLEKLGLKAMLVHLDDAVEEAARLEQGYTSFLGGLVEKEILTRSDAAS